MKTIKVCAILFLVAVLFLGCGKTQPTPPVATTTAPVTDASPEPTTTGGKENPGAQTYVEEWVVIQGDYDTLQQEWNDLVSKADTMDKTQLKTKLDEHIAKHEAIKNKVDTLKADNDDTKAHQALVVEVIEVGLDGKNAFRDDKTKEGIAAEEKAKLGDKFRADEEAVKTKYEEAKTKLDELIAKYGLKKPMPTVAPSSAPSTTP